MNLTPEERRAIEAYTGPIQKIPMGKSVEEFRWDPKSETIAVFYNGQRDSAKAAIQRQINASRSESIARRIRERDARREKIRELAPTMFAKDMAEYLGVSLSTVSIDLRELGIRPKRWTATEEWRESNYRTQEGRQNQARIRAAHDPRMTSEEIARIAGLGRQTTERHMRKMGLKWQHRPKGRQKQASSK